MNSNFTLKKIKQKFLLFFLLVAAGSLISCAVVESIPNPEYQNANPNRKEKAVRIYPDWIKRIMHVKSIDENPLDLFVFDLDGTLICHFKMTEGDHKKIEGLERGVYVYQVFKEDEMSESGKINIK